MEYDFQHYHEIDNKILKAEYPDIYSALNLYYPVGIRALNPKYKSFIGYKSLETLIVRSIESAHFLKEQWNDGFIKKVKSSISYPVRDATFGYSPNYGGEIILSQSEDLRYSTKLMFLVSFIKRYYSLQIVYTDRFVTFKRKHLPNTTGNGILKVVVSPVKGEYQELFVKIEKLINEEFDNALFLPFRFDITKLKDFETPTSISKEFSTPISKAFFNKGRLLYGDTEIIGDIDYGMNKIKTNHNNV